MKSKNEGKLFEKACKNKLLSRWPDSQVIESRINNTEGTDFVIRLEDGSLVIAGKRSQKSGVKNGRVNLDWNLGRIEPESIKAILQAIKLDHPILHSSYTATRIYDEKSKKKLTGFKVSLARTTASLTWSEIFLDDPLPAQAQWKVADQSAKARGRYLVVVHTLKGGEDGKSKQINEYKLEIDKISKAIYDSTLKFKTFPFNIPHSHKIKENNSVTYDRGMDEWEQHADQKGLLEDSSVQSKTCINCDVSFYDTSAQLLCFRCLVAEQSVTRKVAVKLCKQAEKLTTQTDWKQTADAMKQLQGQWQELKSLSYEDSEELWARFQTATQLFFDARTTSFDKQDKVRLANKKKAERLIAKVKKIAGSTNWKETGDAIKSLQQDWKAVNPLPRDDADNLWQQFRAATQT